MKKKLIFYCLIIPIILSCSKEECDNPIDCLPPITSSGQNSFGCLVDGKLFTPTSNGMGGSGNEVYYEKIDSIETLTISSINQRNGSLVLISINDKIESGETYNLDSADNGSYGMYSDSFDPFYTFENASGTVKIIRFDLENGIVSGVFSFNSRNESGESVQVNEGRFDLEL